MVWEWKTAQFTPSPPPLFALMLGRKLYLIACRFPPSPSRSFPGAALSLVEGDNRCAVRFSGQETPVWHRRAGAVGGMAGQERVAR